MDPEKVKVVAEWLIPENRKQLQRFLHFANFYRRLIHNYSQTTLPLTQLSSVLRGFSKTPEANSAFCKLKELFTCAPILCHPNPSIQFIVEVGAFDSRWVPSVPVCGVHEQAPNRKLWKGGCPVSSLFFLDNVVLLVSSCLKHP